ncbi:hypothetical protein [Sphingomonas sp. GB1N7]|uniref:hypothetical protein n=1 Tax=Parasphingomonas caseinilytica TaxID=3096158 RepID=UPI002FCC11B3
MTEKLARFVAQELAAPVRAEIRAVGEAVRSRLNGVAVLFYGSALRTGDLDGVLDFYVLTEEASGSLLRRAGMRWLWPDVSFHEVVVGDQVLRAKVATMPIATFEQATRGSFVDTTIWTRFVQPSALLSVRDALVARRVRQAVADAAITAARFAGVLGPERGAARDYWLALFRETYRAEMRVEPPGREKQILIYDPARYEALLPIAWEAGGIVFADDGEALAPFIAFEPYRALTQAWLTRVRLGKALNIARLVKATFTFEGAARYGLWKVRRHTGVDVALTPWRERHPVLAAPGVLWRVMRTQSS